MSGELTLTPPITDAALANIPSTKLLIPRARTGLVHRERLAARLEAGQSGALTLVSAPAGYGKTTEVVDWLVSRRTPADSVAWLSLDDGDNDPAVFAGLLVAAVRASIKEAGDAVLASVSSFELHTVRRACTLLINALMNSPHKIILVLDDYHVIRESAIHAAMVYLLEHLPPQLHVIVLSREDPPFPLGKLRASGGLCELRVDDLRFTASETAQFLREVMELPIRETDAAALGARTEGWIVGLKLAALSMPRTDPSEFIAAFGGSNAAVLDYLTAEVLARQPRSIQTFLVRTSVLDRLSGSLCAAVMGDRWSEDKAQALLERVERRNLFLVPLEEQRCYRYHRIFADLLRARLRQTDPGLARDLHCRASGWYETRGYAPAAIRHALAAPDIERAMNLIEQHGMTVFQLGQIRTILDWFRLLPPEAVSRRPLLSIIHAYALHGTDQLDAAERCLDAAAPQLRPDLSPEEVARIEGHVAFIQGLIAGSRGELSRSIALADQAANLLPSSDPMRVFTRVWAGRAYLVNGNVTVESERAVATAVELARAAGAPVPLRVSLVHRARVHMLQGRLGRAAAVFAEAEKPLGPGVALGKPAYCFGRAQLLRQRNDLDGAERFLAEGMRAIAEGTVVMPYNAVAGYITLALVRQARRDDRGAIAAVDALVALAGERQFDASVLTEAGATRAHLWLMQGNLVAAAYWADTSGLGANDEVCFLLEHPHLVLARVLIAQRGDTARPLLDRLLADAEGHGRFGSAIEILALRAQVHRSRGQAAEALHDLERALAIGEPEGYVRVFVDEGAPMATLLRRARARGVAPDYCARLLEAFSPGIDTGSLAVAGAAALPSFPLSVPAVRDGSISLEPLSARERDVVRLVVAGASNREIADRLFVATNTVKKHIHNIFGKFDLKSRAQLIVRLRGSGMNGTLPHNEDSQTLSAPARRGIPR
jgi:LuxR family transcriptional regulator, maltose regulon positive regulatory protein